MMGLLEQKLKGLLSYIDANTPRATRPVAKPSQVINQGLINPNKYNEPAASRFKDSAFGLLGVVPGLGDAASAVESADLFKRGDKVGGFLSGLGALPLVPALGAVGHTVYHGSPHKFDAFDMSKIGTGEGAQAYGHGLYFAENPDVARSYQATTTNGFGLPAGENVQGVANVIAMKGEDTARKMYAELGDSLEPTIQRAKQAIDNQSAFYKVDIPDESIPRMLDWDKPLSEQAPEVQSAIKQTDFYKRLEGLASGPNGRMFAHPDTRTGAEIYKMMSDADSQSANVLKQQGIPGIRYLDGASRNAGDGTSNFVLFDDQLPRILEVNGQPTGLKPWAEDARGLLDGPAMSKADEAGGLLGKVDNAGMGKRGMVKQGGKAADALPLGNNLSDDEVFRKMWDALDNAGDGYIGVRGDDFPVKTKFRKSWNRPDGERTTRLPGTSVIGLGVDNITEESLREAIKSARGYGKNLYLIEGEAPHRIQYLANDPGEHLVTDHKILWSTLFD